MHSDPIADMLTRLRNGCGARLSRVEIPHSNLKERIAAVLKKEGYITDYRLLGTERTPSRRLEVALRYDEERQPVMGGIDRISKPGRRQHLRCKRIPQIRNGMGIVIVSTSRGLMTDREAREARLGGEALCSVW